MILTTLLAAAALSSFTNPPQSGAAPGTTSAETAEGVQVLQKLLIEGLDKAFQPPGEETPMNGFWGFDQSSAGDGLVTTLWAGSRTVDHARSFHLPDVGLFLTMDVSLPVVNRKAEPQKKDGPRSTDDEWERARREVRGDLSTDVPRFQGRMFLSRAERGEIDPQAIDQVIDLVLRTLAKHAGRVEGVGERDSVTVALQLTGRGRAPVLDVLSSQKGQGGKLGSSEDEDDESPDSPFVHARALSTVLLSVADAPEQKLVIRVGIADLASAGDNVERLRSRAQINRY